MYTHLIFLCVVNVIFIFFGIALNTLVIASIWKSSQLRKKLSYFMIMVLSCFDLVAVVTSHAGILLCLISWLREDYDSLTNMETYLGNVEAFIGFSMLALLVMSIERYLGAYYPIFHPTSVTRRRLLTLLVILDVTAAVMHVISENGLVISSTVFSIIFTTLFLPLFMFVNFKLFTIARKVHRERTVSPGERTTINLKNISMVLWVFCLSFFTVHSRRFLHCV